MGLSNLVGVFVCKSVSFNFWRTRHCEDVRVQAVCFLLKVLVNSVVSLFAYVYYLTTATELFENFISESYGGYI